MTANTRLAFTYAVLVFLTTVFLALGLDTLFRIGLMVVVVIATVFIVRVLREPPPRIPPVEYEHFYRNGEHLVRPRYHDGLTDNLDPKDQR